MFCWNAVIALALLGTVTEIGALNISTDPRPYAGEEVYVEVWSARTHKFAGYLQSCGDGDDQPHVCAYTPKKTLFIGKYGDVTTLGSVSFTMEDPAKIQEKKDLHYITPNWWQPYNGNMIWTHGDSDYIVTWDEAEWDLTGGKKPIQYNTPYYMKEHRWNQYLRMVYADTFCMRDAGKWCIGTYNQDQSKDQIYIKIQSLDAQCKANKVSGQWVYQYTIPAATTETWKEGTEKKYTESKTEQWTQSVSITTELSWEFLGMGGKIDITAAVAHSTTNAYSHEWATTTEHDFSVTWSQDMVGKAAWQFKFDEYDTCHHKENTLTREYAVTEGQWRQPCCVPGWSVDAPHYTTCHSKETMTKDGEKFGCKVAGTSDVVHV